jgi:hypothetical protein
VSPAERARRNDLITRLDRAKLTVGGLLDCLEAPGVFQTPACEAMDAIKEAADLLFNSRDGGGL